MRILSMMVLMVLLVGGLALAATVNLTDGRVVQGDIVKQDNKSLQINVDGVTVTYYADEIKDIDGKPFASGQTASAGGAVRSVPAVQHEAVNQPVAQPEAVVPPAAVVQPEVAPNNVGVSASTVVPQENVQDKKALILKFIDVFGTRKALSNNFEMMLKQIEKQKPDEAQKIRDRVRIDEIIERLIPVYERNFTSEDLKAFIAFYGSAEGQKLINTIPQLMKESVQESIKYMEEKFPEVKQGH